MHASQEQTCLQLWSHSDVNVQDAALFSPVIACDHDVEIKTQMSRFCDFSLRRVKSGDIDLLVQQVHDPGVPLCHACVSMTVCKVSRVFRLVFHLQPSGRHSSVSDKRQDLESIAVLLGLLEGWVVPVGVTGVLHILVPSSLICFSECHLLLEHLTKTLVWCPSCLHKRGKET
jgi:hypothetical protein